MKFLLFALPFFFLLIFACSEDSKPQNTKGVRSVDTAEENHIAGKDTVYQFIGQSYLDSIPHSSDTTFLIDGEQHTLQIRLKLHKKDTVYYDEPYAENESIEIVRYFGRDVQYLFRLLDSKGTQIWKKTYYKKDYMSELGSLVAQSNMHLPKFETYLESTGQMVLTQFFGVPSGDTGIEGLLLFTKSGRASIQFHQWYGSSGGECEVAYSADSSCLLTCSEIITSTGTTSLKRKGATMAGTLFVGSSHIFVAYVFDKDRTALGGRLYSTSGKLVKEFEFDGYSGGLGYNVPRTYLEQVGNYYFVDEPNKFLMVIPENAPVALKKVPFSSVRVAPNPTIHDTIIMIETEWSQHKIGLNSKGEIRAHQMRYYGDEWKFYDEIKH